MLANITVGEYMSSNPVFFKPNTNVMDAIHKLMEIKSTGAPVLDDSGKLVGAFSELDCLRITVHSAYHEDMGGKVSEFMTQDVTWVDKETSILEVAELFTKSALRHFPVIENGKLVGVISRVDVLKALLAI
ncbi:MAG: CBS domain-containing protein [Candidatus Methylumidiphilus sp.]|nr:CBS domain-containing protein [Pseudomonadota bacterium]